MGCLRLTVIAALAILLHSSSAIAADVRIDPGKEDDAELVDRIPVNRPANIARTVVMRLEPGQLLDFAMGDLLLSAAELQVTTRCDIGQKAPGCGYAPHVGAQIVLSGSPDGTTPDGATTIALSEPKSLTCTKLQHHCVLVFDFLEGSEMLAAPPPCPSQCYVNLAAWAFSKKARAKGKDKLLIGENKGDFLKKGKVGTDKGRLMLVRERGATDADRAVETSTRGAVGVPTTKQAKVIHSRKLKPGGADLKAGEKFAVFAEIKVRASSRARFSTKMLVTKDQNATSGGIEKIAPGEIAEHNGTNCKGTCTVERVAVFRVTEDVPQGNARLNIWAVSAVPGGGRANVDVISSTVTTTRYGPN